MTPRLPFFLLLLGLLPLLGGCQGIQSALDPAGIEAERIARLAWLLFALCGAVLLLVCVLAGFALFGSDRVRGRIAGKGLVIGGGIVFPTVVLSALLIYGFTLMGLGGAPAEAGDGQLKIEVVGERWWWRVTYVDENGRRTESANEIRLPVGRPVRVELTSADVIHSFWVPRLAGKLDMIPGRTNVLTLSLTETGMSRGQCAEYCGGPHALMSFYVIGMPEAEFADWIAREAGPAIAPPREPAVEGMALFKASGCGGCHSVRGTEAAGRIGPDLTHVGARHSIAAGTLKNDRAAFETWLRDADHVKPGNLMPPYKIFTDSQLAALASYLDALR
jgi:cytochrome c oxidase subunit 2